MSIIPLHSVSVAGVTFDDKGRVLLIRRADNNEWQAPGGVLELDETFEEGVIREVLEETGISVRVERLTGVYKNIPKSVVALVYRCSYLYGTPRRSEESVEVDWFEADSAISQMTPVFGVRVLDAASASATPASRAHDGIKLL